MAGRTWEKTSSGRFTPAGEARNQRANAPKLGFDTKRLGVTSKYPNGKISNTQAQKMIKNGDKVKMNIKGKEVTVEVTKVNRNDVIKNLTANEASTRMQNFLVNAGRAGQSGAKEYKGTTKVYRGTADNPKVTSRGSERGSRKKIKD